MLSGMLQSRQARPAMKVRNAFLRILLCQIEHLLTLSYMAYFKVYHNFAASLKWSCVGIILEFEAYFILVHNIHDTSLPTILLII